MSKTQKLARSTQLNVAPPQARDFLSASTTLQMEIEVYPYDAPAAAAHMDNLLADAMAGKPLSRSKDTNELAARACVLRGRKPASGQAWANKLAGSLTGLND